VRTGLAFLVLAAMAAATPAAATAGSAHVRVTTDGDGKMGYRSYANVEYEAGAGEVNTLTVSGDSSALVLTDATAAVTPGEGCTAVDPSTIRCEGGTVPNQGRVPLVGTRIKTADGADRVDLDAQGAMSHQVDAGDGDDRIEQLNREGTWGGGGAGSLGLSGGAGDDTILSGPGEDFLTGGPGSDRIAAGPGPDRIHGDGAAPYGADVIDGGEDASRDTVLYDERSAPVHVDLANPGADGEAGEGDRLAGVEKVIGGAAGDELRGDAGPNELVAGGDTHKRAPDVLDGREGDDTLSGSSTDDHLTGGLGNDSLTGYTGNDRIKGGPGNDFIGTHASEADPGYSRISCGSGADRAYGLRRHDVVPRDCEEIGAAGGLGFVQRVRIKSGRLEMLFGLTKQVLDECSVRVVRLSVSGPYHRRTERAPVLATAGIRIRPRERRIVAIPLDRRMRRLLAREARVPLRLSFLAPYECTSGRRGDRGSFTVEL
jgi:Ca2+-binding RTX toxin-like protein